MEEERFSTNYFRRLFQKEGVLAVVWSYPYGINGFSKLQPLKDFSIPLARCLFGIYDIAEKSTTRMVVYGGNEEVTSFLCGKPLNYKDSTYRACVVRGEHIHLMVLVYKGWQGSLTKSLPRMVRAALRQTEKTYG